MQVDLSSLPKDLCEHIYSFLDASSLNKHMSVCQAYAKYRIPWEKIETRSLLHACYHISIAQVKYLKELHIRQLEPPSNILEVFLSQQGDNVICGDTDVDNLVRVITGTGDVQLKCLSLHGMMMSSMKINTMLVLPEFTALSHLDLSGCVRLGDLMMGTVSRLPLQSLILRRCFKLTDEGFAHLKHLRLLKSLCLAHCHITNTGLTSLRDLCSLSILDISNCPYLSDQFVNYMAPTVTKVDISGITIEYDAQTTFWEMLHHHLPLLKELNIAFTNLVSFDSLNKLEQFGLSVVYAHPVCLVTSLMEYTTENANYIAPLLFHFESKFFIEELKVQDVTRLVGCMTHSPFFL